MKLCVQVHILYFKAVVPHEGTWIEIAILVPPYVLISVVPHEGTWIEIKQKRTSSSTKNVVPHGENMLFHTIPDILSYANEAYGADDAIRWKNSKNEIESRTYSET